MVWWLLGAGVRSLGSYCLMSSFFGEDEKVLEMNGGDGLHDSMNGFNATELQT